MKITNHHIKTNGSDVQVFSSTNGVTVVKSLEIISPSNLEGEITIYRKNSQNSVYGSIEIKLEKTNYLTLWEGFFVIPEGHSLWAYSTVSGFEVVVNSVEEIENS